ncbi:methylated-DNA--[protein]-cysteine S-methyltransferase [Peptostreptococcus anaerobius]|uniref:methylated-DNA--[protein]-cysteine S-methyltransferase n=1 Tax=Peptostreptococcus anaerobius TaxID=1261 RepID=UPI002ED638E4
MLYLSSEYSTPIGDVVMACDKEQKYLVGLWFLGQKYFAGGEKNIKKIGDNKVFENTRRWLDQYFAGDNPSPTSLDIKFDSSDFRMEVWNILMDIPYGKTVTYGDIADIIAQKRSLNSMSAQAVGGAVGHNPVSIVVPCHRVVGKKSKLVGYAAGIDKKRWLLDFESGK